MALINCSECSWEISDKDVACLYCGCPIKLQHLPSTVNCLDCRKDFPFNDDICPYCGLFNSQKYNLLAELEPEPEVIHQDTAVFCPKCNSRNAVTAGNKGFSVGKAVIGGVLTLGSPLGLLGGLIGRKKTVIACLKCGHKWSPEV